MRRHVLVSLGVFSLLGGVARAQSASDQVWGNVTLDFPRGERLLYEIDFEPKAQFSGDDTWHGIDVDPAIEFSPNRWLDLVSELNLARTKQSDAVTSWEVSPRIGVRVHFLNNLRTMLPGRHRLGRVGIANFSRVEWPRNLWYSDDTDPSHQTRFRNRVELKAGLNHARSRPAAPSPYDFLASTDPRHSVRVDSRCQPWLTPLATNTNVGALASWRGRCCFGGPTEIQFP